MSDTRDPDRLPAIPALCPTHCPTHCKTHCKTHCDAVQLLARLSLNTSERQFAIELGEQVVDLVIDAHWMVNQRGDKHGDACVAAAVAYALALLNEPQL